MARYADRWNVDSAEPALLRERSALLDQLLVKEGRQPQDVKRTAHIRVFCGRDLAELDQRFQGLRAVFPTWADLAPADLLQQVQQTFKGTCAGTPEEVVTQLWAYADIGLDELILQWTVTDDVEGLRLLADYVLPHFGA